MLGDPVRARALGVAARATALSWPDSAERTVALATAEWLEGEGAYRANDVSGAKPLIESALTVAAKAAPESKLYADLLLARARLSRESGAPQSALIDLQGAYKLFTRLADARGKARALQSIGSIYLDARDYDHVLSYYRQALELTGDEPTLRLSASNNMAVAYQNLGRRDEAAAAYAELLRLAKKLGSPLLTAQILTNIGDNAIETHDYRAAVGAITAGLRLSAQPAAAAWRPMLLATRAKLALAQDRLGDAQRDIAVALAEADDDQADQSYSALQLTAYRVFKAAGDGRNALAHLEAYRAIDDKGRALAASTNAALMTAQFDFANQNAAIATLKAGQLSRDIALTRLRARQSTVIFSGVLASLVAAVILLFIYLRSVRRNRAEVMRTNAELARTNVELGEALQAKSQFLATTSHEIRTPLNGILGMTQVLLADHALGGVVRDRVGLVDAAGRAMRTLVDDILDFARMDSGVVRIDTAPTDLSTLIPEIIALWHVQAQAKGLDLQVTMTGVDAPLLTDAARLRQVVFNLLSNAIKFTAAGTVKVDVHAEDTPPGQTLVIAIADSGIGIPADAFETIFEPFRQLDTSTTRQYGGTGLGLAISRHLARVMGGDIGVASEPGGGATFTLRIPYSPAGEAAPATRVAPAAVLVVATNPIRRSFLRTALEAEVGRAEACDLDTLAACVASHPVGVVLLDVGDEDGRALPEAVLAALAAVPGRPPLVLLVPAGLAEERALWLAAGAAEVVAKPLRAGAVAEVLRGVGGSVTSRPVVFADDVP